MAAKTNPLVSGNLTFTPEVSLSGTLATPLSTISGSTGAIFSGSNIPVVFGANDLSVGDAIHIYALARKRGANGTAVFRAHFGTNNSTLDGNAEDISLTNANNQDVCASSLILITSNTVALVNPNVAWNSQGTDRFRELTINLNAPLYLNFAIGSANALDSFDLLSVRVQIWRGS